MLLELPAQQVGTCGGLVLEQAYVIALHPAHCGSHGRRLRVSPTRLGRPRKWCATKVVRNTATPSDACHKSSASPARCSGIRADKQSRVCARSAAKDEGNERHTPAPSVRPGALSRDNAPVLDTMVFSSSSMPGRLTTSEPVASMMFFASMAWAHVRERACRVELGQDFRGSSARDQSMSAGGRLARAVSLERSSFGDSTQAGPPSSIDFEANRRFWRILCGSCRTAWTGNGPNGSGPPEITSPRDKAQEAPVLAGIRALWERHPARACQTRTNTDLPELPPTPCLICGRRGRRCVGKLAR